MFGALLTAVSLPAFAIEATVYESFQKAGEWRLVSMRSARRRSTVASNSSLVCLTQRSSAFWMHQKNAVSPESDAV